MTLLPPLLRVLFFNLLPDLFLLFLLLCWYWLLLLLEIDLGEIFPRRRFSLVGRRFVKDFSFTERFLVTLRLLSLKVKFKELSLLLLFLLIWSRIWPFRRALSFSVFSLMFFEFLFLLKNSRLFSFECCYSGLFFQKWFSDFWLIFWFSPLTFYIFV